MYIWTSHIIGESDTEKGDSTCKDTEDETETDNESGNNQLLQLCMARTAWSASVIRSNSVIKLVSVLFCKCTTLVAKKCLPVETRLQWGDQWKAEKLVAFWRWPITRCSMKSDRARLIIEHSINFHLTSKHWRVVPRGLVENSKFFKHGVQAAPF